MVQLFVFSDYPPCNESEKAHFSSSFLVISNLHSSFSRIRAKRNVKNVRIYPYKEKEKIYNSFLPYVVGIINGFCTTFCISKNLYSSCC